MTGNSFVTYKTLKEAALSANISPLELEELKANFRPQIASKRRYDAIRSVGEFIDVLERRDELSEENIEFYHRLRNHCRLPALEEALSYYCVPKYMKDASRLHNEYRDCRLADSLQENLRITRNYSNSFVDISEHTPRVSPRERASVAVTSASFVGILSDDKRKVIYKKLCKELGRDWRNFGRELNIREGEMDNIESQSQDLSTRIAKLLKIFEEDECNNPKEHCLLLCRALEECQRKDLRRQIEKIMSY